MHLTDCLLSVCSGHCFLPCPSGEWLIPDGACSDRHPFVLNVLLELQMMPWDQTMQ